VDAIDHLGRTPIMLAAENGCFESVRVLLDHNANVDIRDSENKTVLHYAIGVAEILKEILKVKAGTEISRLTSNNYRLGNTPLHYAARHGYISTIHEMFTIYLRDVQGQTPLHYAARQGSKKALELILENKPDCLNVTDKNQNTAIHMAALGGHAEILEFLL
ncbi:predicted protein, partial [Nematostella vectensis]